MAILVVSVVLSLAFLQGSYSQWPAPRCNFSVEMMFAKDFSDSFRTDQDILIANLADVLAFVDATYPESKTGFSSFVDKPLIPFGYPYQGAWFEGDWCLNVTHEVASGRDHQNTIDEILSMREGGGHDWPENQLGALHDLSLNGPLSGWTTDAYTPGGIPIVRVLVMSTDSPYHVAGHGANSTWELPPNVGSPNTDCIGEDYPSIAQVRTAIQSRDIQTFFLVGNTTDVDVLGVYEELLLALGTPGDAYSISPGSDNDFLEAMRALFAQLESDMCGKETIDIIFSQDVTYSYSNDMSNFQGKMETLIGSLQEEYVSPRFGLTTFGDKPLLPLGHGPSGDYCFRVHQALPSTGAEVVAAADGIRLTSGADWRESQLDGLISSVLDDMMVWRHGTTWNGFELVRIVVIATDSGFHRAPDAATAGHDLAAHSGGPITGALCLEQEYPTWQQVADALVAQDVHPLFVPTSDIARIYVDLLEKFENSHSIIGHVVELADFGDLANVVVDGVRRLREKVIRQRRGL